MTYATQADLEERFGAVELAELTDRANGTVIDVGVVGLALADADAEINGYLATRYVVPVAVVPPLLVRLACDIARYYLFDDRTTEAVRQRYQDAVRELKNLASGATVLLGADTGEPTQASSESRVLHSAPARMFGPDQLRHY